MRKLMILGLFVVGAVVANARPVQAGCFTDLGDCYYRAANVEGFWYRWAAGLDCELDLIECTRIKLVGG